MKKILVVLVALAALLVLVGIAVVFLVDVNAYKPRIETAVSDALGMEFRIRGQAALRLLPPAGVSFSDISLRNRGTDLASVETLRVGVRLLPLLSRRVEVTDLILEKPVIRIEKGETGRLNTWTLPDPKKPAGKESASPGIPLLVANAAVRDGSLVYVDRNDGEKTEISGINLSAKDISLPADSGEPMVKGIRFSGTLKVKKIAARNRVISDVEAKVTGSNGVFDVHPFTMTLFGGKGEGEIRVDLSKEKPALSVKYTVSNFRAGDGHRSRAVVCGTGDATEPGGPRRLRTGRPAGNRGHEGVRFSGNPGVRRPGRGDPGDEAGLRLDGAQRNRRDERRRLRDAEEPDRPERETGHRERAVPGRHCGGAGRERVREAAAEDHRPVPEPPGRQGQRVAVRGGADPRTV